MLIAIVEDELKLSAALESYLSKDDFDTTLYNEGNAALEGLINAPPDLVLLDLMLPGLDGLSICKEFRKHSTVPVIMLTARVEEIDRLLGLEIGADDYICKPYSPREVVARVKAVLRRTSVSSEDSGNQRLVLDESVARVLVDGNVCILTAVELRLLKAMMERPGQIFNRSQLMRRIYTDDRIVSERTIDSHIKKLRQKLSAVCATDEFIHSVYGIGYKYEVPV